MYKFINLYFMVLNMKSDIKSEILTIMLVDVESYVRTTSHLKRESFNEFHDLFDELSIPIFRKYDGKIIKKMGDAFLVTFKSPTDSVLCGIELQNTFVRYNKEHNLRKPIRIRVVLHTGEVILRNRDIYGDAVNLTSRIENMAEAGHVYFTESVFLAMNKNEIPFLFLGAKKIRGLPYPVKLFRVKGKWDEILKRKRLLNIQRRRFTNTLAGLVLWLVILAVVGVGTYYLVTTGLLEEIIKSLVN